MAKHFRLWHSPYNGGWIWFDRKQWKQWRCGFGLWEYNHIGERERDNTLYWCFFGFCGRFTIQSLPWQMHPFEKRYGRKP